MKAIESERKGASAVCRPGIERYHRGAARGATGTVGVGRWLGLVVLALDIGCGGSTPTPSSGGSPLRDPDVTRYRLLLHDNPIDAGLALRCYGACQAQPTPEQYLQCLAECPGFEQTPGIVCAPEDVPPRAACFTARQVASGSEPAQPGVVIAVIADVPIAVGLSAVCASQAAPCSYTGAGLVP